MHNILFWNIQFFKQRHNQILFCCSPALHLLLVLWDVLWRLFDSWIRQGNSLQRFLGEYLAAATIFSGGLVISCMVRRDFDLFRKKRPTFF